MISMALQRDVPQYMAIPWFITNVMARTISAFHKATWRRDLSALATIVAAAATHTHAHTLLTFHWTVDVVSVGKDDVHVVQLEPR